MARKNGLNRKEQILCAKWLAEKVPAKSIAKKFSTSVAVVKRFTQAKLDDAEAKALARTTLQGKVAAKQKEKAAVLKEAIDLTKEDAKSEADFD